MLPKLLIGQFWIWKSYIELFKNRGEIKLHKANFKKLMDKHHSTTSIFDVVANIKDSVINKKVIRFKP